MYTFINHKLKMDAQKLVTNGWIPGKGKISGNSIEFDEDCSSYLYYANDKDRDADLAELERMIKEHQPA